MEHPPAHRPGDEQPEHHRDQEPQQPSRQAEQEVPFDGTALEKVSAFLRIAFAEADARGEAISTEDATTVATLLAPLLPPDSQMSRFAATGDAHPVLIHEECQLIAGRTGQTPDVAPWVWHFEQYLAAQTDLGRRTESAPPADDDTSDYPQVAEGVREHGDAFRAYLQLPDIDPSRDDLLQTFHEFYVGRFASMDALLDELTEIRDWQHAVDEVADRLGFDGLVTLNHAKLEAVARETWDIVEIGEVFYAFTK
ncbi:hypothetical protein [Amycolatopsis sp. H20-H5]|uniref:hypothetical protein n=1 Tax=Amycolatopsis sp. H20-H5 TaxID=3046309 RepID=UPI002DB7A9CE|nr:hypothetical protein [Amycolatopsis sp. H20-H5]MEC3979634.1 hypothetical protein [Amycolatopsis sp. H20-H5]